MVVALKRRLFLLGIAAILVIGLVGDWLAGSVLSWPARANIGTLPSDLTGRDVQFPSESGSTIHGWLIPGQPGAGAVVLMHGVRANRLGMLDRARFLSRAGYAVLLFDFQAHGESSGSHITFGYLESRDAQAAVQFMRATAPGEKVGVIGVSMGGAAAILASPRLEVDAMVLEEVYPTIDQAITNRLTMRLGGWARILTPLLNWQFKPRSGFSANDLKPIDHIAAIRVPKLFIVGSADRHTTIDESRQLFAAAAEPKELWVVDGAAHVDLHAFDKAEYERRVLAFFAERLKTKRQPG